MKDTNTGDRNAGDWNTGNWNTGDLNTGDRNAGDCNSGHWNTGNWNTGDRNAGDRNAGDCNSGHWNTGDWNTGHWNTGHWNTGNWNTTYKETGYFNTTRSKTIRVFNKDCSLECWENADKPTFLYFNLTRWIKENCMTDKEKLENPTYITTGGYLKTYDYKEAFQNSYNKASQEDKDKLLKLPNFDAEVFKEISGIDVTEKQTCDDKVVEIDGKKYKLMEYK